MSHTSLFSHKGQGQGIKKWPALNRAENRTPEKRGKQLLTRFCPRTALGLPDRQKWDVFRSAANWISLLKGVA
jgi:hypothetical protein